MLFFSSKTDIGGGFIAKEIEAALQEFYKTPPEKIVNESDALFEKKLQKVVDKMKAEGKSEEEIKKAVSEMEMKRQKKLTKEKG